VRIACAGLCDIVSVTCPQGLQLLEAIAIRKIAHDMMEPDPFRLPIGPQSTVTLLNQNSGFFPDGWARAKAKFTCLSLSVISTMSLQIWVPPGGRPLELTLRHGNQADIRLTAPTDIGSILQFPINVASAETFSIELLADREWQLSDTDPRHAAYILVRICFS
jgi:hypothetical protein